MEIVENRMEVVKINRRMVYKIKQERVQREIKTRNIKLGKKMY